MRRSRSAAAWRNDHVFQRLIANSGWLLSGTTAAAALGLATTVLQARSLGLQAFGSLAVILSYTGLVQRFASFQSWIALIKYGAEALEAGRKEELVGLVKWGFLLDAVGGVSGTIFAFLGTRLVGDWPGWSSQMVAVAAFYSVSVLINLLGGAPTAILRLFDRFRAFTVSKILTATLGVVGALLAYASHAGMWGFLTALLLSSLAGQVYLFAAAFLALKQNGLLVHWRSPIARSRKVAGFSGWAYLASTLDIPVKQLDLLIVSAVVSVAAAGVYRVIQQTIQLLALVADPVYQAVYPQFATMVAKNDARAAAKYAAKVGVALLAVVGTASLPIAVLSPWWLGAFFGQAYISGWMPLCLFVVFKVLSIGCVTLHPLFTAMGLIKYTPAILFVADVVYLAAAFYLGSIWGITGVVLAYGSEALIVAGMKYAIIRRSLSREAFA